MRPVLVAGALAGAALLVALAWLFGSHALAEALQLGLLPIGCAVGYRPVSLALYAWSWRLLIPVEGRPRFATLWRLRWIGEAVNNLLPAAQIGGDLTRARLLAASVGTPAAGAAMVADVAIGTLTQAVFAFAGLAAFAAARADSQAGPPVLLAALVTVAVGAGLLALLRIGPGGLLARVARGRRFGAPGQAVAEGALAVQGALGGLARRPGVLAMSGLWHLAGWFSQVAETWGVLALSGAPASWRSALAIESLSGAARAAAFFIPGGLGVQDGALVYLCGSLGVPLEPALALGLVKRFREVAVGLPGLGAWAVAERAPLARLSARVRARFSQSCGDA